MPPGYTKVSLREPVAAETLRPVDDHVWTFYPELGAQSWGGGGSIHQAHKSLRDLCSGSRLAPEDHSSSVQRAWAMQRHCG